MRPSTSIGTSQCDFDDSRITASSSAEYQSRGSGGGWVVGQSGARDRSPQQVLECPHLVLDDRVAGQHDHPVLAREVTEPERVVRSADGAVVVEVEPRRDAGVRRGDEGVRIVDRLGTVLRQQQVVAVEQVDRRPALDVVELVEQHDVGTGVLEDRGDVGGLLVVRSGQVGDQPAGGAGSTRR